MNGKTDRTRPLCAYPEVARYQGKGSIDAAENFTCVVPIRLIEVSGERGKRMSSSRFNPKHESDGGDVCPCGDGFRAIVARRFASDSQDLDEKALADWATPVAGLNIRPGHFSKRSTTRPRSTTIAPTRHMLRTRTHGLLGDAAKG